MLQTGLLQTLTSKAWQIFDRGPILASWHLRNMSPNGLTLPFESFTPFLRLSRVCRVSVDGECEGELWG